MGRRNLYRKETVDEITTKQHFLPKLYTSFEKNQQENQFSETFSHSRNLAKESEGTLRGANTFMNTRK
jgi:hypothetical protein